MPTLRRRWRAWDLAREHLRQRRSFVWNATNLSRELRGRSLQLFADYDTRVRIVYAEVSAPTLYRQNQQRPDPVPVPALERLLDRWEVPDRTEAHDLVWVVRG